MEIPHIRNQLITSDLNLLFICPFQFSIYHYIVFKIMNKNEKPSFKRNSPIRSHRTNFDLLKRRKISKWPLLIVISLTNFKIKDNTCILPLCSMFSHSYHGSWQVRSSDTFKYPYVNFCHIWFQLAQLRGDHFM